MFLSKVKKILEGCLDLIPSPSPSIKIQILFAKIAKHDKTAFPTSLKAARQTNKQIYKQIVLQKCCQTIVQKPSPVVISSLAPYPGMG